jgi:pimeloyl-ACP methyl ester carboxylesterase
MKNPSVEEKFVETRYGKIYYEEAGKGDRVVVFLHGLLGRPLYLEEMAQTLGNCRIIGPYLPGHGKSFALPSGFLFPQLVEVMGEFLDQTCGSSKLSLVGHSLGGAVAWEITSKQKNNVGEVVLIDPGLGYLNSSIFGRIKHYFEGAKIDFPDKSKGIRGVFELIFLDGSFSFKEAAEASRLLRMVMGIRVSRFFPGSVELVVFWGKKDRLVSASHYKKILSGAKKLKVEEFDGAHHWFIAHPELYLKELKKFI